MVLDIPGLILYPSYYLRFQKFKSKISQFVQYLKQHPEWNNPEWRLGEARYDE